MENITLTAEVRSTKGKNEARRLRATGRIPAILYGQAENPVMLQINKHELDLLVQRTRGENVLIDLNVIGGTSATPLKIYLKDLQRDPVSGKIVHADLLSVSLTEKVDLEIPIHFVGVAPGSKEGGIVEYHLRELEIRSLPQDAPRFIEVDISSLKIGDALHVSDLTGLKEGVEVLSDPETTIVSCVPPVVETAETVEAAEGEAAEPEIIGKGKKEEEAEEEAGEDKK
ncbi:MAG: 50S ribosomal protein L25 [Candidatus Sumerlaeia bacterium]